MNSVSLPTSSMMACAWSMRFKKKPGISKVLIGSISKRMPAALSFAAANFRFATSVAWACAGVTPAGSLPLRQFTCGQDSAVAYSIALSTPARNSSTRSGWQAMPRSPASQLPAGRLCSTCCKPWACNAAAKSFLSKAYGNKYSTAEKPALAARANRSMKGTSVNSMVRLAAKRGIKVSCSLL